MSILELSKSVLNKNWKGKFTIPSPRLYPFQWNWDSGFIALGNLHVQPERALLEIESLFSGQWGNGFLPHILFHNAEEHSSYFPSADYWNSHVSKHSTPTLKSSGITQPPVHGFVLEEMLNHGLDTNRIAILVEKAIAYHTYLYNQREYANTGLVAIWHNWESGMDNSVWWDSIFERIDVDSIRKIELGRKDIHEVKESESTRPKDLDYKRYLYLVDELRGSHFENVPSDFPFQVIDPVFNAILIKSNRSLIKIGKQLGINTALLETKLEESISHFDKYLWNEDQGLYFPYDLVVNEQIKVHCSGSYVPIFANIPSVDRVTKMLDQLKKYKDFHLFPSCFPTENKFETKNYWRGPVWININWMIWKGMLSYNLTKEAEILRTQTIALVEKYGVYEYFNPYLETTAKTGIGGADFSWTAALIIDMIKQKDK